jgi:protein-tyrosine-phosphatase
MVNVLGKDANTRQRLQLGMLALGVGYFILYTPYAALVKGVSDGLVPGVDESVGGLELLPAHVIGQIVAMIGFVLATGWWRDAGRRSIAGRLVPFPGRYTAESGFWAAFLVLATTLNYTFPGASIVFMLVLMRMGRMVIAPSWDLIRGRKIHWYSAGAMILAMTSAIIALADIDNYTLTFAAMLSICAYWMGYTMRFRVMSAHGKSNDPQVNRRYFIEENMSTPFMMLLIVGIPALIGVGPWMEELRSGFTSFLTTSAAIPALLIGVFYQGLFVMTSLIFLDRREFSFGMPVSVAASLLSGIVASLFLTGMYSAAPPATSQYIAAVTVMCATLLLCYPTISGYLAARRIARLVPTRRLLFVCGGNTSRSPMAAAIARAEVAGFTAEGGVNGSAPWRVDSAGVSVGSPGAPLSPEAATVLAEIGVGTPPDHTARQLTAAMCADTDVVYCMTREQRDAVVALAPSAADRTVCLDPDGDVADPSGRPVEAYRDCAAALQTLVRRRVLEQRELDTAAHAATVGPGAAAEA